MADHSGLSRAEEQIAARRRAEADSSTQHGVEASYLPTLLCHGNLRGRGSGGTRAQVLLNMQRVHGNRAVQRQVDRDYEPRFPLSGLGPLTALYEPDYEYKPNPLLPSWASGPLSTLIDYGFYSAGRVDPKAAQPSVAEMVQEHIARAQGAKASAERQQAEKHDEEIGGAQSALTGLPPDWLTGRWEDASQGSLARPQYYDVSPALNPWELQELER